MSTEQAQAKLKEFGQNKLEEEKEETALSILLAQLKGFFNIVLYCCSSTCMFVFGAKTDGHLYRVYSHLEYLPLVLSGPTKQVEL